MTDRLLGSSRELRAEGEELRPEIDRAAKDMYDRIERMEQRLHAELAELRRLKDRFGWVAPLEQGSNRGLGSMEAGQRALGQNLDDQRRALKAIPPVEKGNG